MKIYGKDRCTSRRKFVTFGTIGVRICKPKIASYLKLKKR